MAKVCPLWGLGLRPLKIVPFIAELAACGFAVELPVDLDTVTIHPPIPGLRLPAKALKAGNASLAQALPREDSNFDLCLIQPASMAGRVMHREATPNFGGHLRSEHIRQ